MSRRAPRVDLWLISLAVLASACAPRRLALPTGPGSPRADSLAIFSQATAACRDVSTMTAELTLSGRVGRHRVHGRVLAGLAPAALRLEGVAPFGPPGFIFVARGGEGSLLLPRDRRALASAPPADILRALAGIPLGPDDLRALLSGCVKPNPEAVSARGYGSDWLVADLAGGGAMYLRQRDGTWRIVAGMQAALEGQYRDFVDSRPRQIRLRTAGAPDRPAVDLDVRLQQVELNTAIDPAAFTVTVPRDAISLTLEELEQIGPLGSR